MPPRGSAPDSSKGLLSIGALSAATGIPIDTIRTWERRYGFPVPVRKPSGHRVYPLSLVPRLRRAAQAIARGHRAAEVVRASERALDALLESLPHSTPWEKRIVMITSAGTLMVFGVLMLMMIRLTRERSRVKKEWLTRPPAEPPS